MFEVVAGFGVLLLTYAVKNWIKPKFGSTGVHVFIFAVGLAGAVGFNLYQSNPAFQSIVEHAVKTLAVAITAYEVILKRIFASN